MMIKIFSTKEVGFDCVSCRTSAVSPSFALPAWLADEITINNNIIIANDDRPGRRRLMAFGLSVVIPEGTCGSLVVVRMSVRTERFAVNLFFDFDRQWKGRIVLFNILWY